MHLATQRDCYLENLCSYRGKLGPRVSTSNSWSQVNRDVKPDISAELSRLSKLVQAAVGTRANVSDKEKKEKYKVWIS